MNVALKVSRVEKKLVEKINDTLSEINLKEACPDYQRQISFLLKLGTSALPEEKFTKVVLL